MPYPALVIPIVCEREYLKIFKQALDYCNHPRRTEYGRVEGTTLGVYQACLEHWIEKVPTLSLGLSNSNRQIAYSWLCRAIESYGKNFWLCDDQTLNFPHRQEIEIRGPAVILPEKLEAAAAAWETKVELVSSVDGLSFRNPRRYGILLILTQQEFARQPPPVRERLRIYYKEHQSLLSPDPLLVTLSSSPDAKFDDDYNLLLHTITCINSMSLVPAEIAADHFGVPLDSLNRTHSATFWVEGAQNQRVTITKEENWAARKDHQTNSLLEPKLVYKGYAIIEHCSGLFIENTLSLAFDPMTVETEP